MAPFNRLPTKGIVILIIVGVGIFVGFSILMTAARTLIVPAYNIIDLEFAWTADQASTIMQAWGPPVVAQELYVTYLDFGYLAGYGAMAFGLLTSGARLVKKNGRLVKAAIFFMVISIVSPVSDIIENLNLISMMQNFPSTPLDVNAFVASLFASIKFGVLFMSIGVFAAEVIYAIGTRKRN